MGKDHTMAGLQSKKWGVEQPGWIGGRILSLFGILSALLKISRLSKDLYLIVFYEILDISFSLERLEYPFIILFEIFQLIPLKLIHIRNFRNSPDFFLNNFHF